MKPQSGAESASGGGFHHALPARVELIEVGLRDGLQSLERTVPLGRKIEIVAALIAAGLRSLQIASFVHPGRVPQMADAEALCAAVPQIPGVHYSGLALNVRGVERALAAGLTAIDMGVSASETHNRRNANASIDEGMERLAEMVEIARGGSARVRAGIQSAFGCAYEGPVPQARVLGLVERILEMDIAELTLADSTGMANPLQIEQMIDGVRDLDPSLPIVLHLHDTRGLGLANVYAALRRGVDRFDTAFGGLGGCPFIEGASGNIATEDTVHLLDGLGIDTGIDLAGVAAVSRAFEKFLGRALPARMHHLLPGAP